jgi:hypothetical protein
MRALGIVVLSSFAALLSGLGSYSYAESFEKPDISFSLAYKCGTEENGKEPQTFCLADSFKKGLDVVLVSQKTCCRAKTAETFTDEFSDVEFEASRLIGTENCLNGEGFDVAIIGIDLSAVHVVQPKKDKSALSKDMEAKARQIAAAAYRKIKIDQSVPDVAASPPDVFSVGNVAFLLFKSTADILNQDGLPVLILKNEAFLLEGACASKAPFFFTVKGKLHLAYWATVSCCGCGDSNFLVYDVAGESPKLAYQNNKFSD